MDYTIIHFEIPTADVEKLKRLYEGLFGWKIEKYPGPMGYWMEHTVPVNNEGRLLRSGVNGGFVKKENAGQKPVNYISVESIDELIEKVKRLDGKIGMPKQEVSSVGWRQPWIQRKTKSLCYSRCVCNSSLFLLI